LTNIVQPILKSLRARAFQVYGQVKAGTLQSGPAVFLDQGHDGQDELAIFGGQTRVVVTANANRPAQAQEILSKSASLSQTSSTQSPESTRQISSSPPHTQNIQDMHPSVMEYFALFPPSATSPCVVTEDWNNPSTLLPTSDTTFANQLVDDLFIQQLEQEVMQYGSTPMTAAPSVQSHPPGMHKYQDPSLSQMPTSETVAMEAPPTPSLSYNIPAGIDEQWMAFMSGLFEPTAPQPTF
jgi:hypothetical protein